MLNEPEGADPVIAAIIGWGLATVLGLCLFCVSSCYQDRQDHLEGQKAALLKEPLGDYHSREWLKGYKEAQK